MTDFINFASAVLLALLFAAFQLGGLQLAEGGKLTEAAPVPVPVVAGTSL